MTLQSPKPPLTERAGAIARALCTDLASLAGAVMVVHGVDQIHRPTAWIIAGLALLVLSVLAARGSA
jgi:D-arabinose 5-phosphate isomerase GutQ